jgi:UDP-glucose 4-epimerase
MATYIVTGSSGYIGSVLCKRLKELNHTVVAVDLDPPRHKYYDRAIETNYSKEDRLAVEVKYCDGIFHLAASSLLNPSLEDPLSYYENNVASFYRFLRIIHHYNPKVPMVFASSAAVYGESAKTCYASSSRCNPINPYGFTKLQAEQALNDITKYTGAVPHISFRFFNVAGGYGDVGHPINRPALLTSLSRAVVENRDFTQYGNNIRDYIHVLDVCSGLITGMESIKEDTSESLNLCSGVLTPTSSVVEMFKFFTKNEFNVILGETRAGDPEILKGDNHYTKSYLSVGRSPWGWRPEHSNWKDIIESHWEFVKYDRNL